MRAGAFTRVFDMLVIKSLLVIFVNRVLLTLLDFRYRIRGIGSGNCYILIVCNLSAYSHVRPLLSIDNMAHFLLSYPQYILD